MRLENKFGKILLGLGLAVIPRLAVADGFSGDVRYLDLTFPLLKEQRVVVENTDKLEWLARYNDKLPLNASLNLFGGRSYRIDRRDGSGFLKLDPKMSIGGKSGSLFLGYNKDGISTPVEYIREGIFFLGVNFEF